MQYIKKTAQKFYNDSLYRNSIYLMLSTAVMSFFGFFFWIINARLFSPTEIGLATTMISITTLISNFSQIGFSTGLIRFLNKEENKNMMINSLIICVSLVSIIFTSVFILNLHFFSPKLLFIKSNPILIIVFLIFVIILSLNTFTDSIFIAYRKTQYILLYSIALSLAKIISSFLFKSFGTYGIFISYSFGGFSALILTFLFLYKYFNYSFKLFVDFSIIKKISLFSFGNYSAGIISNLPNMILPLLITNYLGARQTAFYYIASMIINLLIIIPSTISKSLFAEGSNDSNNLKLNTLKALKLISLILIPAILLIVFFGNYILLAFGKEYSNNGIILLRLMSLSVFFSSINYIITSIFIVQHKIKIINIMGLIGTVLIFLFIYLLHNYGLYGVGLSWLLSQLVTSIIYTLVYFLNK